MVIDTPTGIITVFKSEDSTYPGIWIAVNGVELVLVEYDESEKEHVIRVWDSKHPDDDYVYKQVVKDEQDDYSNSENREA